MHPLVVISYNNHFYLRNTLAQAAHFDLDAIVIDNASPYAKTRHYLQEIEGSVRLIRLATNHGYVSWQLPEVYATLPDRFFLTDPDLQWNPRLPDNFPAVLDALCTELGARKVGFALDLSDRADMFQDADYFGGKSIADWEAQFWRQRVRHPQHDLYHAPVDTTFHLFDKRNTNGPQVRVAGDFASRHLPWYRDMVMAIPPHDLVHMYGQHSTISKLVFREMQRRGIRWKPCDACRHMLPVH